MQQWSSLGSQCISIGPSLSTAYATRVESSERLRRIPHRPRQYLKSQKCTQISGMHRSPLHTSGLKLRKVWPRYRFCSRVLRSKLNMCRASKGQQFLITDQIVIVHVKIRSAWSCPRLNLIYKFPFTVKYRSDTGCCPTQFAPIKDLEQTHFQRT